VSHGARSFFWNQKKVLVTGGTGLLGPWLIKNLLDCHAIVTVLVRDFVPDSLFFTEALDKKVSIVRGDLDDFFILQRVLNECDIDTVFHLGAQAIVGYANRSPISTFTSNIEGTWNILEACRISPWVKRIIVASSDKAYGAHTTLPYTEDAALQGRHPYDVSKSCADLLAQSYYHTYKLPVCVTRCGNFFGGGDLHFNRIIPGTIKAILENEIPVIRSDGTFIRDYIFVKDVVDAYLTLAEHMEEKQLLGECFNFSTDTPFTVIDIVDLIMSLMGVSHIKPIIQNKATNEIPAQHLSSQKARALLGWNHAYGVRQGLLETISWYTQYFAQKNSVIFAQEKQQEGEIAP
jgi:CDP-glucose 4,6-dehydratase